MNNPWYWFALASGFWVWTASPDLNGRSQESPEPADNYFCVVCHSNLESEELVISHQESGVGCEDCHGMSDSHSSDEDGLTSPQKMFPRKAIAGFCVTCHPGDALPESEEHSSLVKEAVHETNGQTCTDCHGSHRLEVRTRRWDKESGKLIWKDGTPLMDTPTQ